MYNVITMYNARKRLLYDTHADLFFFCLVSTLHEWLHDVVGKNAIGRMSNDSMLSIA